VNFRQIADDLTTEVQTARDLRAVGITVNQRRVNRRRLLLDSTGWLGRHRGQLEHAEGDDRLDAASHRLVPVDGPAALLGKGRPDDALAALDALGATGPAADGLRVGALVARSGLEASRGAWRPRSTVWRAPYDLARAHDLATGKHLHATVDRALEDFCATASRRWPNDQRDEAVRLLERAHELTASTKVDLWLADQLRRRGVRNVHAGRMTRTAPTRYPVRAGGSAAGGRPGFGRGEADGLVVAHQCIGRTRCSPSASSGEVERSWPRWARGSIVVSPDGGRLRRVGSSARPGNDAARSAFG